MIDLTPKLEKGDRVLIRHAGRTMAGTVLIVDKYGCAGAVGFEGILGGYVCIMPIVTAPDHSQTDLIKGELVEIEKSSDEWEEAPDGRGGMAPPAQSQIALSTIIGQQAKGAYPNGSRVVKLPGDMKDRTPTGTLGTVKGSVGHTMLVNGRTINHAYVVMWDNCPGQFVMMTDFKIKLA